MKVQIRCIDSSATCQSDMASLRFTQTVFMYSRKSVQNWINFLYFTNTLSRLLSNNNAWVFSNFLSYGKWKFPMSHSELRTRVHACTPCLVWPEIPLQAHHPELVVRHEARWLRVEKCLKWNIAWLKSLDLVGNVALQDNISPLFQNLCSPPWKWVLTF